jgi:hypothetical protein
MTPSERRTWFGVITEPGRHLVATVSMALLVCVVTLTTALSPALGPWLIIPTALLGAAWYAYMMRRWLRARRR